MTEQFLIEVHCDDTEEWVPVEISNQPYPLSGGEAETLVDAGSLYKWTLLQSQADLRNARLQVA